MAGKKGGGKKTHVDVVHYENLYINREECPILHQPQGYKAN